MIKLTTPNLQTKELFCHKYWQNISQKVAHNKNNYFEPGLFDYNTFNLNVLGINPFKCKKLLGRLDLSFKQFKPTKEKITVWRGITNPSSFYQDIPELFDYFNKCRNIRPGEIIYMREFPYTSCSCDYAKSFISNLSKDFVNLLFEIEIPKGTRLLYDGDRNVLQRCSKYLCTDNKMINDNKKGIYQHIKLTLLPRDVQQHETLKENLIKILKNLFPKLYRSQYVNEQSF